MGQLISLGVAGQEDLFARFTYNGDGSLTSEELRRNETSTFTRRFVYNSAGFLRKLSDSFLEQEIDHTDGGYGQPAFGDGHISRITFKAHWVTDNWRPHDANDVMDQLGETGKKYWEVCIGALETAGRLRPSLVSRSENFTAGRKRPSARLNYGDFSQRLAHWLEKTRLPATWGHSYAYGNHLQLIKAKYFASGDIHQPLQPDSFHIRTDGQMTREQSLHLWRLLAQNRYLLSSGAGDGQGMVKIGRSTFRFEDLQKDLDKLSTGVSVHAMAIEKLAVDSIRRRRAVTAQQFVNLFFK